MTVRGTILSLILVLACTASFAQQVRTGAKGKIADSDSLAAWYEKTLQLGGITVTGRAADKKVTVEKTSINPSASVTAATGSVLEVLRSSSTVTVDGSGQVSIRGNCNVLILVDGVPTTLDGLGSIPAANVQSIDIVTSPDAKYDAEGTGGIISITSKRQIQEAFTALASANYGFNNFMNGNVAMSYNVGRWGVRLNYNGRYEKDKIESELHRQILQTGNTLDQLIDADKKTTLHNIGLNVNYKLTKQDVLTLDVKAGFPRMNNLQTMHNHYVTAGVASEKVRQTDITFNREMLEYLKPYNVALEAWSPLAEGRHGIFKNPVLMRIGEKYGKTSAQVALKFLIQNGIIIIPKTTHKERMVENINLFDFTLSDDDLREIRLLDTGRNVTGWPSDALIYNPESV